MDEKDLTKMPLEDLKALQTKVNKAIDGFEDRRKKEALAMVEAKAREMGYSISDLMSASKKGGTPPRPAKYRHPENPELTWTGRGRQPAWYKEAIDNGVDTDDYLIKA